MVKSDLGFHKVKASQERFLVVCVKTFIASPMVQYTTWMPYWKKVNAPKLGRLKKLKVDKWVTTTQAVNISEVSQHIIVLEMMAWVPGSEKQLGKFKSVSGCKWDWRLSQT